MATQHHPNVLQEKGRIFRYAYRWSDKEWVESRNVGPKKTDSIEFFENEEQAFAAARMKSLEQQERLPSTISMKDMLENMIANFKAACIFNKDLCDRVCWEENLQLRTVIEKCIERHQLLFHDHQKQGNARPDTDYVGLLYRPTKWLYDSKRPHSSSC